MVFDKCQSRGLNGNGFVKFFDVIVNFEHIDIFLFIEQITLSSNFSNDFASSCAIIQLVLNFYFRLVIGS